MTNYIYSFALNYKVKWETTKVGKMTMPLLEASPAPLIAKIEKSKQKETPVSNLLLSLICELFTLELSSTEMFADYEEMVAAGIER